MLSRTRESHEVIYIDSPSSFTRSRLDRDGTVERARKRELARDREKNMYSSLYSIVERKRGC